MVQDSEGSDLQNAKDGFKTTTSVVDSAGPPDTPRASRITKESWGLASLDPSTWPVFKDAM